MRPINLIPEEERRSEAKVSGPFAYVLIGALVILLAGVALLVSTGNQISTSKAEITELESESSAATAQVAKLSAYTKLEEAHQQRAATITSLADSRFDWERVIRELALILPRGVWLTSLSGSVSPAVTVNGGAASTLRGGAAGPALEMAGCGRNQDSVAGFVTALRQIDGVTRVAMQYSKLDESSEGESSSSGGGGNCQTRPWIPTFQIVATFDAAPVSESTTEE
jgi:Tfp pilus assembly protein PilN